MWTEWWDEADIAALFLRCWNARTSGGEQHRLPVSYFEETLPVPHDWDEMPGAYLAFGETYASECDEARTRGWPVRTVPAEHLHQLVKPDQVATDLIDLVGRLGIKSPNAWSSS